MSIFTLLSCNGGGQGQSSASVPESSAPVVSGTIVPGQGNDEVMKEIDLKAFTSLTINLPVDVVYTPGDSKVLIVAKAKHIDHILVRQGDGGAVVIESDDKKIRFWSETKIYLGSKYLNELKLNGSQEFDCRGTIVSRDGFSLNLNGASDVEIFGIDADWTEITCNGAADLELHSLKSDDVTIKVNGAGDMDLHGIRAKRVDAKINGAGGIDLEGEADTVTLSINGAGSIDASHLRAKIVRPNVRGIGSIRTSEF